MFCMLHLQAAPQRLGGWLISPLLFAVVSCSRCFSIESLTALQILKRKESLVDKKETNSG